MQCQWSLLFWNILLYGLPLPNTEEVLADSDCWWLDRAKGWPCMGGLLYWFAWTLGEKPFGWLRGPKTWQLTKNQVSLLEVVFFFFFFFVVWWQWGRQWMVSNKKQCRGNTFSCRKRMKGKCPRDTTPLLLDLTYLGSVLLGPWLKTSVVAHDTGKTITRE